MARNLPKTVLIHEVITEQIHLDQSDPQTIEGGSPVMEDGYVPTNDMDLMTKQYTENYVIVMSIVLGMP